MYSFGEYKKEVPEPTKCRCFFALDQDEERRTFYNLKKTLKSAFKNSKQGLCTYTETL